MAKKQSDLVRSRNARLNQARRAAEKLAEQLTVEARPADEDGWNVLFAEIRDLQADVSQCCHEASAYHNALK